MIALGSLGLCSAGTLFGAIAVRTRFREVMLPLLLLPLLVPVISGAVRATAHCSRAPSLPFEPIQLLIVTDAVYWSWASWASSTCSTSDSEPSGRKAAGNRPAARFGPDHG